MQAWKLAELSIPQLAAQAAEATPEKCARSSRIAVLGDCATQNYTQTLAAVLKLRGCWPHIYEAEFRQISQEILDPRSGLYAHRPVFVVLFQAVQTLQDRWADAQDKPGFASAVAAEIVHHWDRLLEGGSVTVIHHNYCLPLERPFGNYTSQCPASFPFAVRRINDLLAEASASRKGVAVVDNDYQAAYHGKREWLSERFWCQAKQALSPKFLPPLAKVVSDVILARLGAMAKCVVLDLDNTLWSGILGDDGVDGIELGDAGVGLAFQRFQRSIAQLKDRGILLAVCSKNHEETAREAFRTHPEMVLKEDAIVAFIANYENKAGNIRRIREMLDLGLDSFVFLDDSPFERDLVRTALPEVQVPDMPEDPAEFVSALARWNLFETPDFTEEDLERVGMYKANVKRVELRDSFADLESYLKNLDMVAEVAPFSRYSLPRVAQLIQRSNQFNLTTYRHGDAALAGFAASERHLTFTIRLLDRLGDNGIVVCVVAERDGTDLVVDTWVMSCRVLGRKVEELTITLLCERARELGCTRVVGQYRPSSKNKMVADLFPRMGFAEEGSSGDVQRFSLEVERHSPEPLPIRVSLKVPQEGIR